METSGKMKAIMENEASSSSSSIPPKFKYDVFLSFCGKDTRKGFTSHLFKALVQNGFHTFRDDEELVRGERVDSGLLKAIMESRISVVILSKNYAESKWCLDELVKIMECRKTLQQIVLPIFYSVEPWEVRAQKGSLAEAFAKHEKEVSGGRVDMWRKALTEVANLSGWDVPNVSNGDEANSLQKVVDEVWNKLAPGLHVAYHEVGLESRLQELMSLLDMESDCVRIVAIWGMGGIGKTTIAKKLYNHMQLQFDGSSFLANIREIWKERNGDLVSLQGQLLSDILRSETHKLSNSHQGIEVLKQRAFCRKVLLVLDDVDDFRQLQALAIDRDFFGFGSRIIITTRDISSVNWLKVDKTYASKELNEDESLELFRSYCFKEVHPTQDQFDLSTQVVKRLGGLPLALEVLGTFLCGKDISQWKSAVEKLKKIPHHDVQGKLRISIDSLSPEVKNLFLDMACFFVGRNRDFTVKILEGCQFSAEIDIQVLADRCLIKVDRGQLAMHDILRDMGREIVRQECEDPGRRSRLWYIEDVLDVLMGVTLGTEAIKGLVKATDVQSNAFQVMGDGMGTKAVEGCNRCGLNFTNPIGVQVNGKAFEKMNNLWLLCLDYVHMTAGYEHISKRLLWLRWKGFPLKSMPWNLSMVKLVALDLRYSKLKRVWDGKKVLDELKFLYLGHCHYLTETPDFSGLKNLKELFLNDCTRLVNVSESIGQLNKLIVLDMKNCKNLRKVPSSIWTLKTLESLDLSGCSMLGNFSEFQGSLSKYLFSYFPSWSFKTNRAESIGLSMSHILGSGCLKELRMINCNLPCLPNEVGDLISLETLDLSKNNLCTLPDRIGNLTRLKNLSMDDCNLSCLPNEVGNLISLECLHLDGNNLLTLPDGFCNLASLGWLRLNNCKLSHLPDRFGMLSSLKDLDLRRNNLRSLPPSCSDLASMEELNVDGCERLQSLPKLPVNLKFLRADGCTSLESIPTEFNWPDGPSMDFDGCNMLAKGTFLNNLMERIGRSLSESQCNKDINIHLPGDDVPSWFKYISTGSRLSLVVPRRIRGLFICIVFTIHVIDEWAYICFPVSVHKSPPFEFKVYSGVRSRGGDQIHILYVRSDPRGIYYEGSYLDPRGIYSGEELEIAINLNERDEGKVSVKKCGINFIYEGDEDDTKMPDEDDTEMPISKKRKIIEEII